MDSSNNAREAADQMRCSSRQLRVPVLLTPHTIGTTTPTTITRHYAPLPQVGASAHLLHMANVLCRVEADVRKAA